MMFVHLSFEVCLSLYYRFQYHKLLKRCQDLQIKLQERKHIITFFNWDPESVPQTIKYSSQVVVNLLVFIAEAIPFMNHNTTLDKRRITVLRLAINIMESYALQAQNHEIHPVTENEILEGVLTVAEELAVVLNIYEVGSILRYLSNLCLFFVTI